MAASKPPEVRQLQQLLQEKLIPWVQNEAPLILLDTPPDSTQPLKLRASDKPMLPALQPSQKYPRVNRWKPQQLNAISVAVLGCIFEGEADYRVHTRSGEPGKEWIVPMPQGTLFAIPPDTPFSDGSKVAWERPAVAEAFSRGILIHLRRDGASCHTFTCHNEKLWIHPYVFVYQLEVWLLGAKLLDEMRGQQRDNGHAVHSVAALYWQLILRLLLRAVTRGEYSVLQSAPDSLLPGDSQPASQQLLPERVVGVTTEYIRTQLNNARLSSSLVAEHVGLSERHLNRLFEKEMDTSVFGYIQQQRGEKARDLLAHSEISVGDVAEYCGFSRISVFSAWYSRRYHCTPSEHRRRHQKQIQKRMSEIPK